MPGQPVWFHRLDEILTTLRGLDVSHLDRLAVEKLFGVRERRARQIMAGLSGLQVGNAFAVERTALLARVERVAAGERCQWEIRRRARLVEDLDRTQRMLAGRKVRIPLRADPPPGLGKGVELKAGELRIQFLGAEDLAAKLLDLSRAMAADWSAFTKTLGV